MKTLFILFITAVFCSSTLAGDDRPRQDRLTAYTLELIYDIDPTLRNAHLVREELPQPPKNLANFGTVTFRYAGDPPTNQRVLGLTQNYNGLQPGESPRLELTIQRVRIERPDEHTEVATVLESRPYTAGSK